MKYLRTYIAAAAILTAGLAQAADRLVVVELFTSQGCSSCPPADAMIGDLVESADVLPLSMHVDYWDYIGWKDTFASPAYTQRQRGYAIAAGARNVYTPQIIIGGMDHVIGARAMEVAMRIQQHSDKAKVVSLDVTRDGGAVSIQGTLSEPRPGAYAVVLVGYTPTSSVNIRRGENAGRTITYHNVVSEFEVVGVWNGREDFTLSAPIGEAEAYAVMVQREGWGPIIGAARIP